MNVLHQCIRQSYSDEALINFLKICYLHTLYIVQHSVFFADFVPSCECGGHDTEYLISAVGLCRTQCRICIYCLCIIFSALYEFFFIKVCQVGYCK